jgi:hypothetical protein
VTEAMKLIDEGLTLAGVRRVLALQQRICGLEAELAARDAAGERGCRPADARARAGACVGTRERAEGR